ncbi:MAG: S8 family serine peptidase [Planctomycetota bacterium]|nr:S8 family serine peptidase [Planctomycetota bacterium]
MTHSSRWLQLKSRLLRKRKGVKSRRPRLEHLERRDLLAGVSDRVPDHVDDILYFAEPFFQDGIIAQAANEAFANGVAYFSAAGNNGANSYEGNYSAGSFYNAAYFNWSTFTFVPAAFPAAPGAPQFTGGTAHVFDAASGDDLQGFTLDAGQSITLSYQWDQPFASVTGGVGAATDMDIFVLHESGEIVAGSVDFNTNADPLEVLDLTNTSGSTQAYNLLIVKHSGPDPNRLKYINITNGSPGMGDLEYDTGSSTLYGHANTDGALAVGAASWSDTPEFGVSPPVLRTFTSQGGTEIRFDAAGAALTTPLVHNKPDVIAPDGGNTTFFGADSAGDADTLPNFSGTSSAAAHAAGAAALLLGLRPSATTTERYDAIRDSAVDMEAPGFDFRSGYGLIDVVSADTAPRQATKQLGAEALLDAATWNGGSESVQRTLKNGGFTSDELVPVDLSKSYELSGWARSGDDEGNQFSPSNRQYFGFAAYDIDANLIAPHHVMKFGRATDTTLAVTLKPGDRTVVLTDSTGWNNAGASHQRSLAWYGYSDSTGHVYDDYTYTRNVLYNNAWNAGGIDYATHTITLASAWAGPELVAGSAVRNAVSGGTYNYAALAANIVPNEWTEYSATISGVNANSSRAFRPGTAYVKLLLLPNYRYAEGNRIAWKDTEWTYAAPEPFHGGDRVELHVNTLDFPGPLTYQWTQTSGPAVTLNNADQPTASFTALTALAGHDPSFDVTVSDGATSITDNIVVPVIHMEPHVRFRLAAVDFQGAPINSIEVGEQFQLNLYAEDTRQVPEGLYTSYVDVGFDEQLASALAITSWGSDFGSNRTGSVGSGVIDEGGGRSGSGTPTSGGERFLFSAVMRADAPGTLLLQSNPADALPIHDVLLYGTDDAVRPDFIDYGSVSLEILPGGFVGQNGLDSVMIDVDPAYLYAPEDQSLYAQFTISAFSTQQTQSPINVKLH